MHSVSEDLGGGAGLCFTLGDARGFTLGEAPPWAENGSVNNQCLPAMKKIPSAMMIARTDST